jgi:hypothetical protein
VVGLPCVVSDIGGLGDGDLTPSPLRKVADMVNPWLGLISELTTKRSSFPLGNVGEGEESCGRGRSKKRPRVLAAPVGETGCVGRKRDEI